MNNHSIIDEKNTHQKNHLHMKLPQQTMNNLKHHLSITKLHMAAVAIK